MRVGLGLGMFSILLCLLCVNEPKVSTPKNGDRLTEYYFEAIKYYETTYGKKPEFINMPIEHVQAIWGEYGGQICEIQGVPVRVTYNRGKEK